MKRKGFDVKHILCIICLNVLIFMAAILDLFEFTQSYSNILTEIFHTFHSYPHDTFLRPLHYKYDTLKISLKFEAAILEMTDLKMIAYFFRPGNSQNRILRKISYRNESVPIFYYQCPLDVSIDQVDSRLLWL